MRGVALGLVLIGLACHPATAVEVSGAADRLLWCSSAFYWLSADAYDAGNDAEGDQYEAWSDDLGSRADLMLESEGKAEAEIEQIRNDYDLKVLDEMGKPGAKYDVTTCPDLVSGQ
jgi:hypothetical protein